MQTNPSESSRDPEGHLDFTMERDGPFRRPDDRPYDPGPTRERVRSIIVLTLVAATCGVYIGLASSVMAGAVSPTKGKAAALMLTPLAALTSMAVGFYVKGRDRTA